MRETPQAAAAFQEYCALGPERSLRKLAESKQAYSKRVALLMRWSVEHQWQERVKTYDAERIEEQRRKRDAAIEEMNEQHAVMGRNQSARAIEQIETLIEARKFGSQAAVQLFKISTDLERVARGAPTEHIEQSNASNAAEWQAIRAVIIQALAPFPDAKIAVAEALARMEDTR